MYSREANAFVMTSLVNLRSSCRKMLTALMCTLMMILVALNNGELVHPWRGYLDIDTLYHSLTHSYPSHYHPLTDKTLERAHAT